MRNLLLLAVAALLICACNEKKSITVEVGNPIEIDRSGELVEIPMDEVNERLQLSANDNLIVLNENNRQVAYQITYDNKLIFPVDVKGGSSATYTVEVGTPEAFVTRASGRRYPERVDDIAWENDKVAFRTYGPALQATGERAFGYDVWTKSVPEMVVEERYALELNPETLARIDSLKKIDPKAAAELRNATSYHVDHGNGLDCYKVGPTLGGGTAALYYNEEIIYPYAYTEESEGVVDNGPLRFSMRLKYNPLTVGEDTNVVESRIISLDAGFYLNKAVISYSGLSNPVPVVTGIVLHEPEDEVEVVANASEGYISYVDPTENPDVDNGKIYVGAVFPAPVSEAKAVFFGTEEQADRGADGHVLGISEYIPGSEYVYYFGSGWSKAGFENSQKWVDYLSEFSQKIKNPLSVTLR